MVDNTDGRKAEHPEEQAPRIVKMPTQEEVRNEFEAYAVALGRVAHAWNGLFEQLGRVFLATSEMKQPLAAAIWYSLDSDRTKLTILKATITSQSTIPPTDRWPDCPKAKEDLLWLVERVSNLMDKRNDAIHAPCSLTADHDGAKMTASQVSGHERARKLRGKDVLVEFDWLERWTDRLNNFAMKVEVGLQWPQHAWPDRPSKPDQKSRKDLLLQPSQKLPI